MSKFGTGKNRFNSGYGNGYGWYKKGKSEGLGAESKSRCKYLDPCDTSLLS